LLLLPTFKSSGMSSESTTESASPYRHIENMTVEEVLSCINQEDRKVAEAVALSLPQIGKLVEALCERMLAGGRLFYLGAGTSGRLGVLDASECPPTFGVPADRVVGIIAGGQRALMQAVEHVEDDAGRGWKDLQEQGVSASDLVVGISASGTTAYVLGALLACREHGIATGSICCNPDSPIGRAADFPIEVIVGPEFITGSTRMKAGTAQKMVLNMISTAVMVRLGRVEDNKMIHLRPLNRKLLDRGALIISKELGISDLDECRQLLLEQGSVKEVLNSRRS
jgi:N-acetylmuramic acid 6-phosphate etherase